MSEFIVQDAFFVRGKGYIFYIRLPKEIEEGLQVGHTIAFSDDEQYVVTAIERANYLVFPERPSLNVGVLIRGDLKYDKNTYYGKKFHRVVQE